MLFSFTRHPILPALLAAILPALAFARGGGREFEVRPAPSWVDLAQVDTRATIAGSAVRYGVYSLLDDEQIRVSGGPTGEFHRRVRRILSTHGVQSASELNLDFDPSYQRLVIHEVAIIRADSRINALVPDEVRVMEKEAESQERIYDGVLTAVIFVNDVRPGDVLDYSWSLEGSNPILDGKFADEVIVSAPTPTHRLRRRVLWPDGRTLRWRSTLRGFEPSVVKSADGQVFTWERSDIAARQVEDMTPDWLDPNDRVQLSELASWQEVAQWADRLFQPDAASVAAVKALAARFRSEQPSRDRQIVAAIRFVQDEVRYLGIEMGRNSHQPHQPAAVLAQRWGDCKDKSFLLAAILRELGVDARPALVDTKMRHKLDEQIPSPFLFDHVIVQAIDGGKTYWIDATVADQGGTLATIDTPNDERALVVGAATTALAKIATVDRNATVIEQTYTSTDYASPTALEVRSTYSGSDADDMRTKLSGISADDFAKEQINHYAKDQPKIAVKAPPKISDDRDRNVITIVETYEIRDLWSNREWSWYPRVIEEHLHRPDTMIRSLPLAFDHPLNLTQRLIFNLPNKLSFDSTRSVTEDSAFRHEYSVDSNGRTLAVTHKLRSLADSVPVAEVPDHLTKLNALWDRMGYTVRPRDDDSAASDLRSAAFNASPATRWIGGAILAAVVAAILIAAGIAIVVRRRGVPAKIEAVHEHGFRPGEAASSAVDIRDDGELSAHLAARRCDCGAAFKTQPDMQHARYDDRDMTIVTRSCTSCGREQSLYFCETGSRSL